MRHYFSVVVSFIVLIISSFLAVYLTKKFGGKVWKIKRLGKIGYILPVLSAFAIGVWVYAFLNELSFLQVASVTAGSILFLISASVVFSMLVVNFFNFAVKHVKNYLSRYTNVDPDRRRFLKLSLTTVPLVTLGTTSAGIAGSFEKVRIPKVDVFYPNLPDELNGFTIAHLSDLHVGYYFTLNDLEKTLDSLSAQKPDIFVVTGDIADDLDQLDDTLKLINQLKTPLGGFASLGNHEFYRGLDRVFKTFQTSPFPLLVEKGATVEKNGAKIYIGGASDPVSMHSDISHFLERTVQTAMYNAPEDAFRVLLSHRPKGFDAAVKHNIPLTLAGHTHGGQVGFNNKSLFEKFGDNEYIWGLYHQNDSYLYTSSGMGHWFPFRLGCPPEAPLIVLRKGTCSDIA